ncbi:MAG: ABC transporter substrate-binding protein [Anaerolineae bacterium]|nr:ABC transporter substrate-binding protein [Anaerolineae bacterium]
MKNRLAVLVIVLSLLLASVGTITAQDPVEIEFYFPVAVDAPITEVLNGYIADFEAENPDIVVTPVYAGGYPDVMTAIMTTIDGGGQPPAVAVLLATALYDLINADAIAPLDGYIAGVEDSEAYLGDFLPAFLANSYYDDQLWSLPFQRSAVVLYYNADLLAEAGIEPPNSWDALAEAAQALTVRDGDEVTRWGILWPSDWPYWLFQPLAIGSAQNIVGDSDSEVYFDNPDVIEAVQYYIDLSAVYGAMPVGVQANWGQATTDFASGAAAMVVHSTGSLSGLLAQADFEIGVMAVPGQEADTYASVPGGGNLYVFSGAPQEEQDAAWRFIEFLTQPAYAADWSINTGYIASRASAYETDAMVAYVEEVPQALQTRAALDYAGAELSVQDLSHILSIFHNYLQAAFNGVMTPAEAMATAQTEADDALAIFRE